MKSSAVQWGEFLQQPFLYFFLNLNNLIRYLNQIWFRRKYCNKAKNTCCSNSSDSFVTFKILFRYFCFNYESNFSPTNQSCIGYIAPPGHRSQKIVMAGSLRLSALHIKCSVVLNWAPDDEGDDMLCAELQVTETSPSAGITIRGRFWNESMAGGLYTSLEKTPVAGRLRRLVWLCKTLVTKWVRTEKPVRAAVQEL